MSGFEDEGENRADLADLFPGFAAKTIGTRDARIFLRLGGDGPPLLLLHGFPETHVMWHRVAPELARHFTLVIPDLRGYGWSSVPASDETHEAYSKRAMALDMVDVMEGLGFVRFAVTGHDRGGRVAYRLALDHPGRVERLAVLDIVPTHSMWTNLTPKLAMKTYHWLFLAQPEPLPEMLIRKAPVEYLEYTLASWTKARDLSAFDPRALAHYRAFYSVPERIHATCEDYRAGASIDLVHDEADFDTKVTCPLFALWSATGYVGKTQDVLQVWREYATDVRGRSLPCGHYLPEEMPDETAAALRAFLLDKE
jgi:haloacetate dehalogenase